MAVKKLSAITQAGRPSNSTDFLVGVDSGNNDLLFAGGSLQPPVTLTDIADPAASTLTLTGGTALTTSQPVLNMTQGWNNAASAFTGAQLTITATAYDTTSRIFRILETISGRSLTVNAAADLFTAGQLINNSDCRFGEDSVYISRSTFNMNMWNDGAFAWCNSGGANLGTVDTFLYRDGAAGIVAQRNSTNAQTLRVYNTYTSSTNYERGVFDWGTTANVLTIGTEKGSGGGSARNMQFVIDSVVKANFGVTTASTWTFVGDVESSADLYSNNAGFLIRTNTTQTAGSTANVPTLTSGPVTGNPTKWIAIDDNGTTRYIPAW